MGAKFCVECHFVGSEKSHTRSTLILEIGVWIAALVIYQVIDSDLSVIAPLIALGFSLWRNMFRYKACPKCLGKMIPADTPKAQAIIQEQTQSQD